MIRPALVLLLLLLAACAARQDPDWNRKDAHRSCRGAIAAYPDKPAPPCSALRMCANEAQLSPDELTKLSDMAKQSGCAPF